MTHTVTVRPATNDTSRDRDFYGWAMDQGRALREGRLADLDRVLLAEAIEDMGRAEKRELTNRLAVLLAHLLNWAAQPDRRGRSWSATIEEQRDQARLILRDNPSLRPVLPEVLDDAYHLGTRSAVRESELPVAAFPAACPWTLEQAMDEAFWPEPFEPG
jgi:hypothetical protein